MKRKNWAEWVYSGQDGTIAPSGNTTKWGKMVARVTHCNCCPLTDQDLENQKRIVFAWNATRHLSIKTLERTSYDKQPRLCIYKDKK